MCVPTPCGRQSTKDQQAGLQKDRAWEAGAGRALSSGRAGRQREDTDSVPPSHGREDHATPFWESVTAEPRRDGQSCRGRPVSKCLCEDSEGSGCVTLGRGLRLLIRDMRY